MEKNILFLISIVILFTSKNSTCKDVVFLGMIDNNHPAVEKTYDRLFRENLSVMPYIHFVDYVLSQKYRHDVELDGSTFVSRNLLQSLQRCAPETTLFIWGKINSYKIEPKRKGLIRASINGELKVDLTMYSLENKEFTYNGTLHIKKEKPKGVIWFDKVSKVVHITALEHTEMLENLEQECATQSGAMVESVIRNLTQQENSTLLKVKKTSAPTISDVFTVPSVEAREIRNQGAKKNESKSGSKTQGDTLKSNR